jgi:hypothetical protein
MPASQQKKVQYNTALSRSAHPMGRRGGEKKGKTYKSFRIGLDPKFSTK